MMFGSDVLAQRADKAKLLLGGKIYTIVREFLYCISILNMV